ncbi:menaquinol-cytochrome C reductase, partial [Paenibacillus alvei]|nr:menaquinol-cytochrome C reductase [Paenibacillus alvei]
DGKGGMPSMVEAAKKEGLNDQDIEHIADWLSKQKAAQ